MNEAATDKDKKKAANRAAVAAYRARHPERVRANARKRYRKNAAAETARNRKFLQTPKGRFLICQRNAAKRGVSWQLSFQEWLDFWGDDLDRRGQSADSLVMARFGDTGPYAIGNVKKITRAENTNEWNSRRWKR